MNKNKEFILTSLSVFIIVPILYLKLKKNKNDLVYTENFLSKKNDIIYIENFLSKTEFKYIQKYTSRISNNNLRNEGFRQIYPLNSKTINDILYSKKVIKKIEDKLDNKIKLYKSKFPIEYRIYPTNSQGMKCHKDTILYDKPQYECIYTIHNNSDSFTTWYDYNNKKYKIYSKPNSMIIVKAGGNEHCVSKITRGTRNILKLIYTQTNNYNSNYENEMKRFL